MRRWLRVVASSLTTALALLTESSWAQSTDTSNASTVIRVHVERIEVQGNTLLPSEAIAATVAPFRGDRDLAELKQAALAVQALYSKAGFGAVVAYLPPQSLAGGLVTIQVVEGRLGHVQVVGNAQHSEANIRATLPALIQGATPRVRELDAQIQLANENPSKQVRVMFQPAQEAGSTDARIMVNEQPLQRWSVDLDNTGNNNTGELRANLGWQYANLGDLDHVAAVQFQTSPSHPNLVKVLSAGYHMPLYAQQISLDAYLAHSDVGGGTITTPVGGLQFNGRGNAAGLRANHVLSPLGDIAQRVSVGLDYRSYLNDCGIEGLPPGACGTAGESVSVQPLSVEYALQRAGTVAWAVSIGLLHNLQIGGGLADSAHFEAVRPGAKPHYTTLRFSGMLVTPVLGEWQLRGRLAGQFSPDALVPGEQFGLGGLASVRGYEERELSGDTAGVVALELVTPDLAARMEPRSGQLNALAFVDAGWIQNHLDTPCLDTHASCRMASVGLGARYNSRQLRAQLYVAQALTTAVHTQRNHIRAHFSVGYSF